MRYWRCTVWLFVFLFLAETAGAQIYLPSETERQAAYCIPVLRNDIESMRARRNSELMRNSLMEHASKRFAENTPEPQRATMEQAMVMMQRFMSINSRTFEAREQALDRVTRYLQPRLQHLDDAAMSAAAKSAEWDMQEWTELSRQCRSDCSEAKPEGVPRSAVACFSQCTSGDLDRRLAECRNPVWLPTEKD